MDGPSVLAALTQQLLVAAGSIGLDAEALAAEAGIAPELRADPDARVPLAAHFRLWELLSVRPIGLALGTRIGMLGLGVIGYAMQHGATVGEAIAWQRRYASVVHPDVIPALEHRGDRAVFVQHVPPPFTRLREPVECQASAMVAAMRGLTATEIAAVFIAFPMPRPADPSRQEQFFACPIAWAAPALEIAFDASLLSRPLPRSDPQLFGYLARRAEELRAALPDDSTWSARVRREIGTVLSTGEPRIADIAKRFAVSERTLSRRLEGEDVTFASLLDDARRERALFLIEDTRLSGGELAFLLGYSEPTAFFRAFKRWTGETPGAYRATSHERVPSAR